jgi:CelD/BcsL family acetyltransferase involved in cellulose biosynthesis
MTNAPSASIVRPLLPEPVASLDDVRDDWTRLGDAVGSPFSTWEWASTWWHHYGAGRTLRVVRCRSGDGRTAAIFPLCVASPRPLGILRFIGHGPADQLAPICAPEDREAAAGALRRTLMGTAGGSAVIVADRLPSEQLWRERLGGHVLERRLSPVLEADGGFGAWLATRSAHFRQRVRYSERRLRREHRVEFRLSTDPDQLESDFATLVRLHRARWGSASRAFTPDRVAFHLDFARVALERGWLRLWSLELDGRAVSAWLGFRFGGIEWYYQAGRDPALEREAVGFVLLVHTIREALDGGLREYRFLLGGEDYKARLATRNLALETVVLGHGATGRAVVAAAIVRDRLRRRLRRMRR